MESNNDLTTDLDDRPATPPAVSYTAVVTGLKEVILAGTADLAFWRRRLSLENLYPLNANGRAEILIGATDSRWMGIRFKEMTISIAICLEEESEAAGYFLVEAFNSSRLFTFMERSFFRTPYRWGRIGIKVASPYALRVGDGKVDYLAAEMAAAGPPTSTGEELWEGAIYLPAPKDGSGGERNVFFARLAGFTAKTPFRPDADRLIINPSKGRTAFKWLIDSGFSASEWRVRLNAAHARTQTVRNGVAAKEWLNRGR